MLKISNPCVNGSHNPWTKGYLILLLTASQSLCKRVVNLAPKDRQPLCKRIVNPCTKGPLTLVQMIVNPCAIGPLDLVKKIAQPTACTLQYPSLSRGPHGNIGVHLQKGANIYLQTTQVSVSECHLSLSTVFSPVGRQKGVRSYVHKYKKATRGKTLPCQL